MRYPAEEMQLAVALATIFTPSLHGSDSCNAKASHDIIKTHFSQEKQSVLGATAAREAPDSIFHIPKDNYTTAVESYVNSKAKQSSTLDSHEFAKVCLDHWGDDHPVGRLAAMSLVMTVSSVKCERAYTTVNLVKNKTTNRLSVQHVDDYMIVQERGPTDHDYFDPTRAIKLFLKEDRRMIKSYPIPPTNKGIARCHRLAGEKACPVAGKRRNAKVKAKGQGTKAKPKEQDTVTRCTAAPAGEGQG